MMSTDPVLPPAPTATPVVTPQPADSSVPAAMAATTTPSPTPDLSTDPLSGAMLQQLGQDPNATQPTTPANTLQPIGSLNKESVPSGLPVSTEIPLTALKSTSVESAASSTTPETGASAGSVEVSPSKELEPEVESTQEKIASQKITALQETVVAADKLHTVQPQTVSQPVVVLPLTEKGMNEGQKKSTEHSIRWLYEWCVRQIRKFKETLVVYRDK